MLQDPYGWQVGRIGRVVSAQDEKRKCYRSEVVGYVVADPGLCGTVIDQAEKQVGVRRHLSGASRNLLERH